MIHSICRKLLPTIALGCIVGLSGCEAFNGDDDPVREDEVELRGGERISYENEEVVDIDRPGRYHAAIPDSAILMNDWVNNQLTFRPTSEGTIYILSEDNDLLYSGRIREGERFLFDRRTGEATLGARPVFTRETTGIQKYRVFFDRR